MRRSILNGREKASRRGQSREKPNLQSILTELENTERWCRFDFKMIFDGSAA